MLLGAPGAGKGTHAPRIVETLTIPRLSVGEMLWDAIAAKTRVGLLVNETMQSGGLWQMISLSALSQKG